jgi:hypothetical protein
VYVPLVSYHLAVGGCKQATHGIVPDHPVRYRIEDLLKGTDKELDLALELARR